MIASLLLLLPFSSCQQGQEVALCQASDVVLNSSLGGPEAPDKSVSLATDIIFKSTDGGQNWQDISAGLPKGSTAGRIMIANDEIFLAYTSAVYHSNIGAAAPNWKKDFYADLEITDIFPSRSGPYISCYRNGFYKSIPGTDVLIPLDNNLKDKTVRTVLEAPDGALLVGCETGLYKSMDEGKSWKQVLADDGVNSLVAAEGVMICGTYKGLLRSTDGGETWEPTLTEDGGAFKTAYLNGRFVSVTDGAKDWKDIKTHRLRVSADGGKTWQRMDENLKTAQYIFGQEMDHAPIKFFFDLKQAGKYLFCSTNTGVFRSADWGKTWESVFPVIDDKVLNLGVSGDTVYAVYGGGC